MSSELTGARISYDDRLTNISVAYEEDQTEFISRDLAPVVKVQKQTGTFWTYDKGDQLRTVDVARGRGSESAGLDWSTGEDVYHAKRYSVHYDLTPEDEANADDAFNLERDAVEQTTANQLRAREAKCADAFFKPGVWANDYAGANTNGTNALAKWNLAVSDPVLQIDRLMNEQKKITGKTPNKLILGADAAVELRNNANVRELVKHSQLGFVSLDLLAAAWGIEIKVANALHNVGPKGGDDEFEQIFNPKSALLTYSAPRPGLKTLSGAYIFAWEGLLGGGAYGGKTKKYRIDTRDVLRIETDMAYTMKVIDAECGTFLSNIVD